MTEYSYYKINPSGNITLIVETPVPRESQSRVAARLMELDKDAEQVGFFEKSENAQMRLQMMGGEFCGNASISAAALLSDKQGMERACFTLEVSGAGRLLNVEIAKNSDLSYTGTVSMPLPMSIEEIKLGAYTLPVVNFEGISHIISAGQLDRDTAQKNIKAWCNELKADALGVMFLDSDKLTPFVYVASTDTAVWESSCASGSTAVAAFLSSRNAQSQNIKLTQPGGVIEVFSEYRDNKVCELKLTGNVKIMGKHLICT